MKIHILGKVTLDIDGKGDRDYCPGNCCGEFCQTDFEIDDKYAIENNLVEKFEQIPFAVKIIAMPEIEEKKETKVIKGDKK